MTDHIPDSIPDPTPDSIPDSIADPIPDSIPDPIPDPIPDSIPDTEGIIAVAEHRLSHKFINRMYAVQAITYAKNPHGPGSVNDPLAAIGSVKMANVLCNWWSLKPGFSGQETIAEWNLIIHDKMGFAALATLGRHLSLDQCFRDQSRFPFSEFRFHLVVEDALVKMTQAIMGAVFLDGKEEGLVRVMGDLGFYEHESGYLEPRYLQTQHQETPFPETQHQKTPNLETQDPGPQHSETLDPSSVFQTGEQLYREFLHSPI